MDETLAGKVLEGGKHVFCSRADDLSALPCMLPSRTRPIGVPSVKQNRCEDGAVDRVGDAGGQPLGRQFKHLQMPVKLVTVSWRDLLMIGVPCCWSPRS